MVRQGISWQGRLRQVLLAFLSKGRRQNYAVYSNWRDCSISPQIRVGERTLHDQIHINAEQGLKVIEAIEISDRFLVALHRPKLDQEIDQRVCNQPRRGLLDSGIDNTDSL